MPYVKGNDIFNNKLLLENEKRMIKKIIRKIIKIIKILKQGVFLLNYIVNTSGQVILLDTPEHGNLGDHAIVLSEKQMLKAVLSNVRCKEITANSIDHLETLYAKFTPEGRCILIHGGGFLGALWPNEEERFRRILTAFQKQKIIVFPQTVTFDMDSEEGRKYFSESHKIYSAHPNLIIFLRDKSSYIFMQKYFSNIQIYLVPDIVLRLKPVIVHDKRTKIVFCMRNDIEKQIRDEEYAYIKSVIEENYAGNEMAVIDTVLNHAVRRREREKRVNELLQRFADAKLVITDRLHGMIFAAVCGTPCIALGNSNGKVKGVYEWIKDIPYITYLNDVKEIQSVIENLDVNKSYQYRSEVLEKKFNPLVKILRKEIRDE